MTNRLEILSEADTRAKLIDPAIHKNGWTEDLIRREETAGSIEIISGKAYRRKKGKVDYVLRIKVSFNIQPVAVALIEMKKSNRLLWGCELWIQIRIDWRTPEELLDIIEVKGREIGESLAVLRKFWQ